MPLRLVLLMAGVVALVAPSALADTSKGALRVSVTVVHSCRVTTDTPTAQVDCGTRPQQVQIVSSSPATAPVARTAHPASAITIEF